MKTFRTRMSRYGIRSRIFFLFTILVILPYGILTIAIFSEFQKYANKTYGDNMVDTLTAVSTQVKASIEKYEESTMSLYYNGCVDLLSDNVDEAEEDTIVAALAAICYSYNGIKSAYLECDGKVYHSYLSYSNLLDEMKPYRQEIIDAGGSSNWYPISNLYGKANTNHYVMARTLNSSTYKNIGILYLVINDSMVADALDQLKVDNSVKYLINKEGTILYCSDSNKFGKHFEVNQLISDKVSGYKIGSINGEDILLASYHLFDPDWYFVSTIAVDDMMKLLTPLKRMIIIISTIYFLFLFNMLYMMQKYVFRPLRVLKHSMDQFASGDLDIKMPDIAVGELSNLSNHFNKMTFDIKNLMENNEKEVREKNNLKMQTLVAQLTPHFIYNALNTIKWMAVINKQDNIQNLTDSLIHILMNAARIDDENYTIAGELELIRNYAVIQKARFMNFDLVIEAEDEMLQCKIHKFLLQPVVENAIIHGLGRGSICHGEVLVKIWGDTNLRILIKDNGMGMDVEQWRQNKSADNNHTNIGLKNIEQIILLEYGAEYGIQVTSILGEGTSVDYTLPIIRK